MQRKQAAASNDQTKALLEFAESSKDSFVRDLKTLVECESPSTSKAGVEAAVEIVSKWLADLGAKIRIHKQRQYGNVLQASFAGKARAPRLLLLGHLDTVYDIGTLATMPWRDDGGYISGPGVFDMKFGVVQIVYALRALIAPNGALPCPVTVLLNSDEEVGSPASRTITEKLALKHDAVLVFEPSAGRDGACKTSRKGVGHFILRVKGKAAHAGLDFASGVSATLELARQADRIAALTDLKQGVTVNVGVIRGGTRSNVVAESAEAEIDVRVATITQARKVSRMLRTLRAVDRRCILELSGDFNRMPFERSAATVRLYRQARNVAAEIGFDLPEIGVGGGSDGNITANLGVPTLDGLGAVGEGAHSPNERVMKAAIPQRIAFAASLIDTFARSTLVLRNQSIVAQKQNPKPRSNRL